MSKPKTCPHTYIPDNKECFECEQDFLRALAAVQKLSDKELKELEAQLGHKITLDKQE